MSYYSNPSSAIFWGIILIVAGFVFLMHSTQGLDVGELLSNYWPVLIVLLGIYIIIQSRYRRKGEFWSDWGAGDRSYVTDSEHIIQSNTFGDLKVTIDTKDFQSGQLKTVFGDVKADLTNLDIVKGERRLHLSTVFGDIKVNTPKDLPLKIYASSTAGDIKIFDEKRSGFGQTQTFKSPNYDDAEKKLFITISHTFGDTKVW